MTDDRAPLVAMVIVALVLVPVLSLNRRIAQKTASGILIAALAQGITICAFLFGRIR